ncbi:MAG: copper amine oxidase N-terminal domain-containing protein, partial [Armatimonadetes bacterium]|nr:copper amine oxidase N-terminal domain-containing protein [Armatimonadota bacterium]
APQLVKDYFDSPVKIYAAFREKKPLRASDLARLLENIGRVEALPWARWDAQKRFLHPMTGKLIHPAEMFPYPSHSNATEGIVSLLLFRVTLQPGTTHRLTVRYSQEPGYIRPEEPGPEPVFRGVHLTYLLRTQSWASYGPIDVEVKIPKRLRLRSSPAVRFVAEQGGERIYRTRLVNPKGNLYITVANPDSFYVVSWQAVNRRGQTVLYDFEVRDPGDATSEHARFISGAVYLPVHILSRCTKIFYAYPPRKRNAEQIEYPHYIQVQWQAGRVLLEAGGRRVELRAGRPTAIVQGRPVRLTKPPVLLEGRTWLHIRDYFACALYLLDTPPNGKRHQLSQNQIRTHFDYRNMKVTVILPF